MKIYTAILICLVLLISGCATSRQSSKNNCTSSVAYSLGLKDGKTPGIASNYNYAATNMCAQDSWPALNMRYLKGYMDGFVTRPKVDSTAKKHAVKHKTHKKKSISALGVTSLPY